MLLLPKFPKSDFCVELFVLNLGFERLSLALFKIVYYGYVGLSVCEKELSI